MKRFLPIIIFLCCFMVGLRAQLNEVNLSYQTLNTEEFGNGFSMSYYRSITNRTAAGLRVNANGFLSKQDFGNTNTVSIDLVNRWTLNKHKKFRFLAELGASVLQRHDETPFLLMDVFTRSVIDFPTISENQKWVKTTYYGFVGSLGFDLNISTRFILGMDISKNLYYTEPPNFFENTISPMNLRVRMGFRF